MKLSKSTDNLRHSKTQKLTFSSSTNQILPSTSLKENENPIQALQRQQTQKLQDFFQKQGYQAPTRHFKKRDTQVQNRFRDSESKSKQEIIQSARHKISVKDGIFLNQGRKNAITDHNSLGRTRDMSVDLSTKQFFGQADAKYQVADIAILHKKLKQQLLQVIQNQFEVAKLLQNCNRAIERYPSISKFFLIRGRTFLEMRKKSKKQLKDKSERIREWETNKFAEQAMIDFLATINLLQNEWNQSHPDISKSKLQAQKPTPVQLRDEQNYEAELASIEAWIAFTHYKMGSLDDAMFYIEQSQKRVTPPITTFRILYTKGLVLGIKGQKKLKQSENCFEQAENKALKMKEGMTSFETQLLNKCYYKHGYTFMILKCYREAIDCFRRAINFKEDDHKSYFRLAMTYFLDVQNKNALASKGTAKSMSMLMQESLRFQVYQKKKSQVKPRGKKFKEIKSVDKSDEELAYQQIMRAISYLRKPEYYCFRGILQLKYEDYDEAMADFDQALMLDPNYSIAAYYRARVLFIDKQRAEPEELLEEVNAAIEADKTNCRAWLLKTQTILHNMEMLRNEIDLMERQGNVRDPDKLYQDTMHSFIHAGLDYSEKTILCLKEDPIKDPFEELDLTDKKVWLLATLFQGVLLRATINASTKTLEKSIQILSDFIEQHENSKEYNKVLQVTAFRQRGRAYMALGEYLKAEKDFDQGVQCMNDDCASETAITLFYRGTVKLKSGAYLESIEDFEKYRLIYKKNSLDVDPECLAGIAQCYHKQEDYMQAIIFYSLAAQIKPLFTHYLIGKAEAQYSHGQHSDALETLQRAQKQHPNNCDILYKIGHVQFALEDHKASIRSFKTCLSLLRDKSLFDAETGATMEQAKINSLRDMQLQAYYNIALSYALLAKFERALWPLSKCIQLEPKVIKYRMERGKVYQSLQLFEEAIEDFNWVIHNNRANAHAYFRRAFAFKAMKDFVKAAEDFEKAKNLDPMNEKLVVSHKHLKQVNFLEVCRPGEEKEYT